MIMSKKKIYGIKQLDPDTISRIVFGTEYYLQGSRLFSQFNQGRFVALCVYI